MLLLPLLLNFQLIDLSHTLQDGIPSWNGSCGFAQEIIVDYEHEGVRVHGITMEAGIGTHIDAPSHFIPDGQTIDQIPLEQCFAPLVVINVVDKSHQDYEVSVEDIANYEKQYGTIANAAFVFVYTGWDKKWPDPVAYRNVDAQGHKHFPGVSAAAAALLLERGIVGLGIDTLSPDGCQYTFPVHHLLFNKNVYIAENMTNGSAVPASGAYIAIMPLKIGQGTESPVRAVAFVPKN